MSNYHIPVLLHEAIESLAVAPGKRFVDCTLGGGGHTKGILEADGEVLALDQDPEAIENSKLKIPNQKLILKHTNFQNIRQVVEEVGWDKVDGVLMDLGVSSHQLETGYRGFSFNKGGDLDMRMDQSSGYATAKDLINGLGEKELKELFLKLGEENFAGPIAKQIVISRKTKTIETTDELANVILKVRHTKDRTHPATRVFQALRIAVNDELNSLKIALPQAVEILKPGGKLVVISFHSLEDRIVKDFFNNGQKPIVPTEQEVEENPRSRSAKMRVFTKV